MRVAHFSNFFFFLVSYKIYWAETQRERERGRKSEEKESELPLTGLLSQVLTAARARPG